MKTIIAIIIALVINIINCYGQKAPTSGLYLWDGEVVYILEGSKLNGAQYLGEGSPTITVKDGILCTNCWEFLKIGPFVILPGASDTIKVEKGKEWYFEFHGTTSILVVPYGEELNATPVLRNQAVLNKWTESMMYKVHHKKP